MPAEVDPFSGQCAFEFRLRGFHLGVEFVAILLNIVLEDHRLIVNRGHRLAGGDAGKADAHPRRTPPVKATLSDLAGAVK